MLGHPATYFALAALTLVVCTAGFVLVPVRGDSPEAVEIAATLTFALTLYGLGIFTLLLPWSLHPGAKAGLSAGLVCVVPLLLGLIATPFATRGGLVDIPPVAAVPLLLGMPLRPVFQPVVDLRRRRWRAFHERSWPDPATLDLEGAGLLPNLRSRPEELRAHQGGFCLQYQLGWSVPGHHFQARKKTCFDTSLQPRGPTQPLEEQALSGASERVELYPRRAEDEDGLTRVWLPGPGTLRSVVDAWPHGDTIDFIGFVVDEHDAWRTVLGRRDRDGQGRVLAVLAKKADHHLRLVAPGRVLALRSEPSKGSLRRPELLEASGRRLSPEDPGVWVASEGFAHLKAGLDDAGGLVLALHEGGRQRLEGSAVRRFPGGLALARIRLPGPQGAGGR